MAKTGKSTRSKKTTYTDPDYQVHTSEDPAELEAFAQECFGSSGSELNTEAVAEVKTGSESQTETSSENTRTEISAEATAKPPVDAVSIDDTTCGVETYDGPSQEEDESDLAAAVESEASGVTETTAAETAPEVKPVEQSAPVVTRQYNENHPVETPRQENVQTPSTQAPSLGAYRQQAIAHDAVVALTEDQAEQVEELKKTGIPEKVARVCVLRERDPLFWANGRKIPLPVKTAPIVQSALTKCGSNIDIMNFWSLTCDYVQQTVMESYEGQDNPQLLSHISPQGITNYIHNCATMGFEAFDRKYVIPKLDGFNVLVTLKLAGLERLVFTNEQYKSIKFKRSEDCTRVVVPRVNVDDQGRLMEGRTKVEMVIPRVITCIIKTKDGRRFEGQTYTQSDLHSQELYNNGFWSEYLEVMLEHIAFKRAAGRFLSSMPFEIDERPANFVGSQLKTTKQERRTLVENMSVTIGKCEDVDKLNEIRNQLTAPDNPFGTQVAVLQQQVDARLLYLLMKDRTAGEKSKAVKAPNPYLNPIVSNCVEGEGNEKLFASLESCFPPVDGVHL